MQHRRCQPAQHLLKRLSIFLFPCPDCRFRSPVCSMVVASRRRMAVATFNYSAGPGSAQCCQATRLPWVGRLSSLRHMETPRPPAVPARAWPRLCLEVQRRPSLSEHGVTVNFGSLSWRSAGDVVRPDGAAACSPSRRVPPNSFTYTRSKKSGDLDRVRNQHSQYVA